MTKQDGTVFDGSQQKELTQLTRSLSWYRIGFFLLLLVLVVSLVGNAYLFFYLTQVDGMQNETESPFRQTGPGLEPPDSDDDLDTPDLESDDTGEEGQNGEGDQSPDESAENTGETEFISDPYAIRFLYPRDWETRQESSLFGDQETVIQVYTQGDSDAGQEDITDGVAVTVMVPVETDQPVSEWIEGAYNLTGIPREGGTPATQTTETVGELEYTVVQVCREDDQCTDYYHRSFENRIHGIAVQIAGPDADRYAQAAEAILLSYSSSSEDR